MIPLNQEQWLGEKAYILMASRKMMPGVIMLLISAILLALKSIITSVVYSGFSAAGGGSSAMAASISSAGTTVIVTLLIISLLVLIVGIIIARLEYKNLTYTFEEFDLRMKKGILHRTENSIPYRQIQDVDIDRSLTLQFMGLSKLTIITAGHEESTEHEKVEVVIEPIQREVAEDIRQMLERKIGVQIVRSVEEADADMNSHAV
jgi:uncharacterized membrane protein YdbT with pleckstrin-like domain